MSSLTGFEMAILQHFLEDNGLDSKTMNLTRIEVTTRTRTGTGFIIDIAPSATTKLFSDGVSFRWGKVGATLNSSIATGYLAYIDNGYLTTLEGYTYGDEWPATIERFEVFATT